jgi:hypothetical protein
MPTSVELRTFATFEAEFPDDAEFTPRGDIVVPGDSQSPKLSAKS